jgi:hypothetical protein
LSLSIHVDSQHSLQGQQYLGFSPAQIDSLQIAFTSLTYIEAVKLTIIREVGQGIVTLVIAIGTLQSLKEPLAIAARAKQPSRPSPIAEEAGVMFLTLAQEGKVWFSTADRAISTPPNLLGN